MRSRVRLIGFKKRSNSAADFRAFDPLSQPEAGFRQNVWQSGTRTACRNTDEFPVPATAALIGRLMVFPRNGWVPEKRR